MVDGIKLKYIINDYDSWSNSHNLIFLNSVNFGTGEVYTTRSRRTGSLITKSKANYKQYYLTLTEVYDIVYGNKMYFLEVRGSLHKSFLNGPNITNLTKAQMIEEINELEKVLCLNSEIATIHNIEIGINIQTTFSPIKFLENSLLSFKGKRFEKYSVDSKGNSIGYHAKLGQYSVKIYDKGLQCGLDYNLMRIEARFIKMEQIKKVTGDTLSMLKHFTQNDVRNILENLWNGVLLNELSGANNDIRTSELYLQVTNYQYMKQLQKSDRRKHDYLIKKFKLLCKKQGDNSHQYIKGLILEEVGKL